MTSSTTQYYQNLGSFSGRLDFEMNRNLIEGIVLKKAESPRRQYAYKTSEPRPEIMYSEF